MVGNRTILLAGAALLMPFAAFAQASQPSAADCDGLLVVMQNPPPRSPVTLAQAQAFKRDSNAKACHDALANPVFAQAAKTEVAPTAGQVTVQQAAPNVIVQQAQPSVTVDQGQPEITVHQPAPIVTVEIPQPVITIRMPKPQVNVAMAQPQVQVEQAKPEVKVTQATQPNVAIQGDASQPKINYTAEQAKVTVTQSQDAPKVNVEQNTQASAQPVAGQPVAAGGMQSFAASKLLKMNVVNARGNQLGDVEHVLVKSDDKKPYVVIGHGGFLGLGEKQVALPLDSMMVRDGKLVMRNMTDDQIRAMPSWTKDTAGYSEYSSNEPLQISGS